MEMIRVKDYQIKFWYKNNFISSCSITEEFAMFAREYRQHIKSLLPEGMELVSWNRGHFYCSGFIRKGDKFVYFDTGDVRGLSNDWHDNILVRTARSDKDYTGGPNCRATLPDFIHSINRLFEQVSKE
jgi:hypothetical protein